MSRVALFEDYLRELQDDICARLEALDGKAVFAVDSWESGLGVGESRIITEGGVFEKGGVNFSKVAGRSMPASATKRKPNLNGKPFTALGVSLVLHPHNPYVPTTHMNLRMFEVKADKPVWWFGGGYDLTPYYPFDADCWQWHCTAKQACDPFGVELYSQFKQQCDDYFYLPHREETRGIGGLFFDDFKLDSFDASLALVKSIGDSFICAYAPIVERRKDIKWSARQRDFMEYRRGRYVEFNLVYDRGTLFGLQSGGRIESILMSLPPRVQWHYQWQPMPCSEEERLGDYLKPVNWVNGKITKSNYPAGR